MVATADRSANRKGAKAKAVRNLDALKTASTEDAALLVSHESVKSRALLRRGLASIHTKLCAAVANGPRRHAPTGLKPKAPKLITDDRLTLEQVWGQLSVVYAPVLKALQTSTRALEQHASEDNSDQPTVKKAAAKPRAATDRHALSLKDDNNAAGSSSDSDAGIGAIRTKLGKPARSSGKRGGGVDPNEWRYALGKPSHGDGDADDDDDMMAGGDAPEDDGDDVNDVLAAGGNDDSDEEDGAEDDAGGGDAEEGEDEGEEEEEDGDSERAAMREMYGDDVSDDAQMFDDEMADFIDEEQAEEAEEAEEDHGGALPNSPFGPDMAPANPILDFADIDADTSLTIFQKSEKKRLRTIEHAEQVRVLGQHWTMQGEVAGRVRPRDSLIDETLEFDYALRPAPVVTEHFTSKLEERIKKRVIDSNFDDVERKVARTNPNDLDGPKHDPEVDAQKSKLSLMDLYEKEYLEKQAAAEAGVNTTAEPLTEVERDELKAVQMWKRLSQHLDALSNFYFTPKPVNAELDARVRATQQQAPAISIEAVGISALAKDRILAPQDVFRPKRERFADVSQTELLPAERRAIRRTAKENTKASEGRKEKQQAVHTKEKARKDQQKAPAKTK